MHRLLLIAPLIFLVGCDFFEQDVFVDIPEHESKVVINSMISQDDTLLRILVTKSVAIDSREESGVALEDANVAMSVNGSPLTDIYFDPAVYYFVSNNRPQPGDTYEIEVEAPGLPTARSTTYMPREVTLTKADFAGKRYDTDGWDYQAIKFTIQDIPDEANYYEVFLIVEYNWENDTFRDEVNYLESPVSFFTPTDRGLAFTDAPFKNNTIDLEIWFDNYLVENVNNGNGKIIVAVRSATESYYEYMTRFYIHEWNQYPDLFSGEPVPMYSNIEGGYGIFSAFVTSEIEVSDE